MACVACRLASSCDRLLRSRILHSLCTALHSLCTDDLRRLRPLAIACDRLRPLATLAVASCDRLQWVPYHHRLAIACDACLRLCDASCLWQALVATRSVASNWSQPLVATSQEETNKEEKKFEKSSVKSKLRLYTVKLLKGSHLIVDNRHS